MNLDDARLSFIGISIQTVGAVLLGATFLALRRLASSHRYLRDWSLAFVALGVALVTVFQRYQVLDPPAPGAEWGPWWMRAPFDLVYQAGKLIYFGALLTGVARFVGQPLPRAASIGGALLGTSALITTVASNQLNTVLALQAPFAAGCMALAAWFMARAPIRHRSFGSRTASTLFALLALLWILYAFSFGTIGVSSQLLPRLSWSLARYNSFIDVMMQTALAVALIITVFQRVEHEAEESRTERAALLGRLAESQKLEALGVLVSGVAHELNNPLTSILGFADVLATDPHLPEEMRAPARTIAEQAQRCTTIVRGLLDVARQRQAPRGPVALADVVERVRRGIAPQLERAGLRVATSIAPDLPRVAADATGLEQVISNLLSNSIDALAPGGTIEIDARRSGPRHVTLRCCDDGPGVPAELRERIFDPFFTTKSPKHGTGLGLAISQRIVRTHGGTIAATERPDGRAGACFVVELPIDEPARSDSSALIGRIGVAPPLPPPIALPVPAPTSADERTPVVAALPGSVPRLLIVDDEAPVRELLRRYLGRHGFAISEAASGHAALQQLESGVAIDVLITDLRMPGMSGMELLERVRARWPQLAARTIAITGDVVAPEVARFVRRRACPVLEKPLDFPRLLSEVTAAARRVTPRDRPGAASA
ncbi:MAG: response regulator [Planctomycetes bacterium]|nr:response regulator [Planctomycetota bacterium]